MKNKFLQYLPFNTAVWSVIVLNALIIVFHTLVLTQVIPYTVVWAGKLKNLEEMVTFETVSLLVNILISYLVYTKLRLIKKRTSNPLLQVLLWALVVLFALNTLGNFTAATAIERYTATPLTFVLAILCCRIAVEKPTQP